MTHGDDYEARHSLHRPDRLPSLLRPSVGRGVVVVIRLRPGPPRGLQPRTCPQQRSPSRHRVASQSDSVFGWSSVAVSLWTLYDV